MYTSTSKLLEIQERDLQPAEGAVIYDEGTTKSKNHFSRVEKILWSTRNAQDIRDIARAIILAILNQKESHTQVNPNNCY